MRVARIASVAKTFPSVLASCGLGYDSCKCCLDLKEKAAYLSDDGVVSGGDLVEDAVDTLKLLHVLAGDAVIGPVIVLDAATTQDHLGLSHIGQRELGQSGKVHLFHHTPLITHLH